MLKRSDSKGLSKSTKTLLIVVLVLISLVIIFIVIKAIKNNQPVDDPLEKFNADLEISHAEVLNYTDIAVKVDRNTSEENIEAIVFIFYGEDNSEITRRRVSIENLEEVNFQVVFHFTNISNIDKISVIPIFKSDSGGEINGKIEDEYKVPAKEYPEDVISTCTTNSQCEDHNACTINTCIEGNCSYSQIANCVPCESSNQCNDSNECTTNKCSDGKCTYLAIPGCTPCYSALQCNDNKSCTENICLSGRCLYNPTTNCSQLNNTNSTCGNNVIEGTEQCDGTAFGGKTCATARGTGYTGTLKCSNCMFNTSLCVAPCTQTCASLGYQCGTQTICGKSVSCGSCSSGTCNLAGQCVNSTPSWQTGMISWWKFDGDAQDSIATNNGANNGATLTSKNCISGQCYIFDGVNDYLNMGSVVSTLLTGNNPRTISLWIVRSYDKKSDESGDAIIGYGGDGDNNKFVLGYRNNAGGGYADGLIINDYYYSTPWFETNYVLNLNSWYHVIATFNGNNNISVYVNGNLIASGIKTYNTTLSDLKIGYNSVYGGGHFNGTIDDVMIWNRALDTTEVQTLFKSYNYTLPSCTQTCSSLGYQCEVHTICGSSVNCGSCSTGTCNSNGKCITSSPTCFDGIQNQGETGVDCGGPCSACQTYSRTFYVSSSTGSDSNTGTSESSPWKTISKVNSQTFVAGEGILFKRGDTWHESLVVSSSGSSSAPVTYGTYGNGEKPIISGFTTVSGWTNEGGGIYSKVVSCASSPIMVTFDGVNTGMGRFPDKTWMTIDSHSGTTSITDADLNSAVTNWVGAEAVVKDGVYTTNHHPITSHSGSTIGFSGGLTYEAINGFGYFIQNDLRTVTAYKEWYYNPGTSKFYIYFGSENPSSHTVKVASLNNAVTISGYGYITINGLAFEGFNANGFYLNNAPHITIKNCEITFIGNNAVDGVGDGVGTSSYFLFDSNTISDVNNNGFYLLDQFTHATISNNNINNVGLIFGTGYPKNLASHAAIRIGPHGGDNQNSVVEYNTITNIGYIGIFFMGTNIIVRNNFIDTFCVTEQDGGALYTYQQDSQVRSASIINNIVLNGIGSIEGTTYPSYDRAAPGIYTDGYTTGITVSGNTVINCTYSAGWLTNSNKGGTFTDNTLYGNRYGIHSTNAAGMANMDIERNKIISSSGSPSLVWYFYSPSEFLSSTTLDYNCYARLIDNTDFMVYWVPPAYEYLTLAQWKSTTGKDAHSYTSSKTVVSSNDIRIEYNPTKENKVVTLDRTYVDVEGKTYSGSVTLKPYTSIILIKN